ncbi:adenylate/guanylate cyclase domain-containing protein [Desulfosarcina alkanivorans]|uniref:adenylate/guanylate cyclase domain-containing protein n=1 Tax=Desulfosarcina alkanivorans TaxID=571177 RepID=UPI0012D2CEE1|nr:adenylate/guanylate cyclase domain-containing protein [Desulfosarcina alkanivorans]
MAPNVKPLVSDKLAMDPDDRAWLSGEEVIEQTGISKRDLIRFIQLRVLPKSMMRVSPLGRDGARKKSYFSRSILGHVAMLKVLRDEGHSVETIATELGDAAEGLPSPRQSPRPVVRPVEKRKSTPPPLHLAADAIAAPAFLVGHDLRIGWISVDQANPLSRAIENELADDPSGTVFDIMLRASLKELVFNWQPLFSFTYRFLQATTSPDTFSRLAPTVSLNLEEKKRPEEPGPDEKRTGPVDSCPIRLEDDRGRTRNMRVYGMALSEGTLFVLDQDRWQETHPAEMAGAPRPAPQTDADAASGKTPFSVISARLDDSRGIVDTLLPETYFQLMTRIWDESDRILASYGGQRAKRSGTEVQYIIPRHADTDPAYDAICCAVELREKMGEIEASLKADGGWFADIRLNIGISSGRDHLEEADPTASMAFMLPGGAADQAFHLSAIAHGGAIWITKSAFGHLAAQQVRHITFGIYRDDRLIPNIFAQVSDLPHAPDTPPMGQGIRSLFVTRIIDLKTDHTEKKSRQ